jgi:hypothetical protein
LVHNLRICIDERSRKIALVRSRYPEWGLAFEDRIAYGALDAAEVDKLRDALDDAPAFARVLLVSPLQPTRSFQLMAARQK